MYDFQAEQYRNLQRPNSRSEDLAYCKNGSEYIVPLAYKALKKTIFIVSENIHYLLEIQNTFTRSHYIVTMRTATEMFKYLKKQYPVIIILSIKIQETDGLHTLQLLKLNPLYSDIPVLIIDESNNAKNEFTAFNLGAADYIKKPCAMDIILLRIANQLKVIESLHGQALRLRSLQTGILSVLGDLLEGRDKITGGHTDRTAKYVQILLNAMLARNIYTQEISPWDTGLVIASSRLHDVGKIAISDTILNKPDKLTPEEFAVMKTHAAEGERIIEEMIYHTGQERFLNNAKLFAGYHHERWDGSGYPYGLQGTDIPLQGRIMALSDVYDAMLSVRPYKKALDHQSAVRFIMEGAGTIFDPEVVRIFGEIHPMFKAINIGRV